VRVPPCNRFITELPQARLHRRCTRSFFATDQQQVAGVHQQSERLTRDEHRVQPMDRVGKGVIPPAKLKYQKAIGMMLRRWRSLWIHCQRKRIMNRNCPRKPIPIHTISRGPSVFRYVAAASSRLCISRDPQHIAAAAVGLTGGRYRIQGQFEPLAARVIDAPDMVEFPRNEVSGVQHRQE
jgi:hypothetical protein